MKPVKKRKPPIKHEEAEQYSAELKARAEELRVEREEAATREFKAALKYREDQIHEAKKILAGGLVKAAQVVVGAYDLPHGIDDDEARSYALKTKNAHYNLKAHGLEINVHELTGKDGTELFKPLELSRGGL